MESLRQSAAAPALAPAKTRAPLAVFAQCSAIAALIGVLYGAALFDMAHDWWTEPTVSHGLLIPPLALYIAWIRRHTTLGTAATQDRRGLLAIAAACLMFLVGKIGAEFFLMRVSFVIMVAGLIWTFWGTARLKTLAFPLLILVTMVPLPVIFYNAVAAPLQLFASDIAARVAQECGVSVYRDGNIISLATVSLGVEEACSGLNSLSAMVIGSLLLGMLLCVRTLPRVLLAALSVPLSIAVNVFRVSATAILADYKPDLAMGFYHLFSGWLVFVAGFGLLYGFAKVFHAIWD